MKANFFKYAIPLGMGLTLTLITVFGLLSTTFSGCTKDEEKHCTNTAYPLWCPNAKVCCTPGHAYYCDGQCHPSGCPSGTITRDNCTPE